MNDTFTPSNITLVAFYQSKYVNIQDKILQSRTNEVNIELYNMQIELDNCFEKIKSIDDSIKNNPVYLEMVANNTPDAEVQVFLDNLKRISLDELEQEKAIIRDKIKEKSKFSFDLQETFKSLKNTHIQEIKEMIEYLELKGNDNEEIMIVADKKLDELSNFLSTVDTYENTKKHKLTRLEELKVKLKEYDGVDKKLDTTKYIFENLTSSADKVFYLIDELKQFMTNCNTVMDQNSSLKRLSNTYFELNNELKKNEEEILKIDKQYEDCYRKKSDYALWAHSDEKIAEVNAAMEVLKEKRLKLSDKNKGIKEKIAALSINKDNAMLIVTLDEYKKCLDALPNLEEDYKKLLDKINNVQNEIDSLNNLSLVEQDIIKEIQTITYELNN